jgi:hypothetical protein
VGTNLDDLPRVGGTDAGGYFELGPDVLLAIPSQGYVQSEAGARDSLREMNRIARERGRAQVLLVLVDNVRSQDAGSRRVWQSEMDRSRICAMALVCESLLARAIGSFFIGLRRPTVPTRMVATIEEGLAWAEAQGHLHG